MELYGFHPHVFLWLSLGLLRAASPVPPARLPVLPARFLPGCWDSLAVEFPSTRRERSGPLRFPACQWTDQGLSCLANGLRGGYYEGSAVVASALAVAGSHAVFQHAPKNDPFRTGTIQPRFAGCNRRHRVHLYVHIYICHTVLCMPRLYTTNTHQHAVFIQTEAYFCILYRNSSWYNVISTIKCRI